MVLESDGEPPILLDLGTGLRLYGESLGESAPFAGTALVTHIHWDHVQGLPFFRNVNRPGATLDVYGPIQDEGTLEEVWDGFMRPPYFPISHSDLAGDIRFHAVDYDDVVIGDAKVRVRPVPHVGPTVGYRVDWHGASVAYVSDHQAPLGLDTYDAGVLELCDGVDLLIHDAQYTPEEFAERAHWGHCTVAYAVQVAAEAGARRLALFHHDPAHGDDQLDRLLEEAQELSARIGGPEVLSAAEGLRLDV